MNLNLQIYVCIFYIFSLFTVKAYVIDSIESKLTKHKNWERYSTRNPTDVEIPFQSMVFIKFNADHTAIRFEKYKNSKFERKSSFNWSLAINEGDAVLTISDYKLLEEKNPDKLNNIPSIDEPTFQSNVKYNLKFVNNDKEIRISLDGTVENPANIYCFK